MIPLSVSIVCAPVVDSQTLARLAVSVKQYLALNVGHAAAMVNRQSVRFIAHYDVGGYDAVWRSLV